MGELPRALIFAVYFGRQPDHMRLFLQSCGANSRFEWMLVGDLEVQNPPDNVRVLPCTLAELRGRIARAVGFKVVLQAPYKICDFRPAFGHVFADLLAGYGLWGHCDLDMIFGSLESFITPARAAANAKLFSRGAFSLYQNNDETNRLYRLPHEGPGFETVFTSPRSFAFDEWGGIHKIVKAHAVSTHGGHHIADIKPRLWRFELSHAENYRDQVMFWDRGSLFRVWVCNGEVCEEEFPYVHFQRRRLPNLVGNEAPTCFIISPRGFLATRGRPGPELIRELNRDRLSYRAAYQLDRLRRRWLRFKREGIAS